MPERHISKQKLESLLKADRACSSRMAEERAAFGQKLTKAEVEEHLNKWAYGVVKKLERMDAAKAAFNIRALLLYIDHLGLAAQGDLEDLTDENVIEMQSTRPQ